MNEKEYDSEQGLEELGELVRLSTEQQIDKASCEAIAEKAKSIYEQCPESKEKALEYAMILVNLSAKQTEVAERTATAEKLKTIHKRFLDSKGISLRYASVLANLSAKQTEVAELAATAEKLKTIHERFLDSKIALRYASVLANLSVKQTEVAELAATAEKLKTIHERFLDSKIALRYAKALVNLSAKQTEVAELAATAEKLKTIYEHFLDSEDIALRYAKVLFNLSKQQNNPKKLTEAIKRIFEILKSFSNIEIFSIVVEILENKSNIPLDTNDISTTSITKVLDKLCFNANDNIGRELLIRALDIDLAIKTKYDILKGWIEHYKDDQNKLNQLIDIYIVVQKIKYQLGLKPNDEHLNIKFGHYTSGKVLQILLEQPEEDNISVYGKTRLSNANYMNDPEEGIIIEKILGLDRRDILEPSSWFLMSFTIKTDDLAMWSQYGDDAQGVCLVLREDDFSRFTSFNDVSWREEIRSLEFINKMDSPISELSSNIKSSQSKSENEESDDTINDEGIEPISEENDNDSKGNVDYLYRIAYINDLDGKFRIEKTELFDDKEIIELETLLESLKKKLNKNLDKKDEFYLKAISDCIEEIRYLFKSVDYKYENELRILRYANLDSENKKIKIDRSSGMGKLYVERENPIQIDEVIFGPKFPNPEYVTPLLKLLDKDIVFKKSMIKFR